MKKHYIRPVTEATVMDLVTIISRSGRDEYSAYDEEVEEEPAENDQPGWGTIW